MPRRGQKKVWTEERRARLSRKLKAFWATMPPEEKEARARHSRERYFAKYPERRPLVESTWEAIEAGRLLRPRCSCGQMTPRFDYGAMRLAGWKCFRCGEEAPREERKRDVDHPEAGPPAG